MGALLIRSLVLLLLCGWTLSHYDEHEHEFVERDPENRFRMLRDDYDISEAYQPEASEEHRRLTSEFWTMIKDEVTHDKLSDIVHRHKDGYRAASPYPHFEVMDVFPKAVVEAINLEIPDNPKHAKDGCVAGSKCYNTKKGTVTEKSKNAFNHESQFGPATLAVFTFMQSTMFTRFLEKLTGIEGILADSQYKGAGIHQTMSKGHLNIHADFNLDRDRNVHRRVNVFLYINKNWTASFNGELELWSRDLKKCERKISPDFGKLVVFSTTDFSYHGHQNPLNTPADRSRRSLALYYYSKDRPSYECIKNNCFGFHNTLFQKTQCDECGAQQCYDTNANTVALYPLDKAYF